MPITNLFLDPLCSLDPDLLSQCVYRNGKKCILLNKFGLSVRHFCLRHFCWTNEEQCSHEFGGRIYNLAAVFTDFHSQEDNQEIPEIFIIKTPFSFIEPVCTRCLTLKWSICYCYIHSCTSTWYGPATTKHVQSSTTCTST